MGAFPHNSISAMARGGKRSTSFKPGQRANPTGKNGSSTPAGMAKKLAKAEERKAILDVKEAAKAFTQQAINTLKNAMTAEKAPWAAKVNAAQAILDRGWGKPTQPVDANVSVDIASRILDRVRKKRESGR